MDSIRGDNIIRHLNSTTSLAKRITQQGTMEWNWEFTCSMTVMTSTVNI